MQNHTQARDWQLVLYSARIPYYLSHFQRQFHIYVPLIYARPAKREIENYRLENKASKRDHYSWRLHKNAWLILLALLPLAAIHFLNSGWNPGPDYSLPAGFWTTAGCLDKAKVLLSHQWFRIFTALTLHTGIEHLAGNLLIGGIFLFLLARIAGVGAALFLTILSGALGNLGSVCIHAFNYKSVGFSTAIFGCLGIMAAFMALQAKTVKRTLLPLGAILGLLALLGTEGQNTDYGAHIMGLLAGFSTGMVFGFLTLRRNLNLGQGILGGIAIGSMTFAWIVAFWQ